MGETYSDHRHKISSSEYCHLYVEQNKPYYSPGDIVDGNIYVSVVQNYPAQMLELKLKGKEKVYWQETETRTFKHLNEDNWREKKFKSHRGKEKCKKVEINRTWNEVPNFEYRQVQNPDGTSRNERFALPSDYRVSYTYACSGKIDIFSFYTPIFTFAQNVMIVGQYTFPFRFILSEGLPGSFQMREGTNGGKIEYKISGILRTHSKNIKENKHSTKFIIRQRPQAALLNKEYSNTEVIKGCCCLSKGPCTISAVLAKDSFIAGETANLNVQINNAECSLGMKSLALILKQNIFLRSAKHTFPNIRKTITETSRADPIQNNTNMDSALLLSLPLLNAAPSTAGSLIACSYTLELISSFHSECCSPHPNLIIPMSIAAPPLQNWQILPPPPNWAPQVYDVQNILIPTPAIPQQPNIPNISDMNINVGMNSGMNVNSDVNLQISMPMDVDAQIQQNQTNSGIEISTSVPPLEQYRPLE
jgi:hypothetical protein